MTRKTKAAPPRPDPIDLLTPAIMARAMAVADETCMAMEVAFDPAGWPVFRASPTSGPRPDLTPPVASVLPRAYFTGYWLI